MDYNFDKDEWEEFIKNNSALFDEYRTLIRFFRYFEVISFYELSKENIETLHFYYAWWRNFMIDVIKIYDKVWETIKDNPEVKSMPPFKPPWTNDLISNLDKKMKKYNLRVE
jgi:hypothetical protein